MMIRILIMVICCLLGNSTVKGQRLMKGQTGVEANVGLVSKDHFGTDNFNASAGITVNRKYGNYLFYLLDYDKKTYSVEGYRIPVENFLLATGFSWKLVSDQGRNFSVNLGIAGTAGYESVNRSRYDLPNGTLIRNRSGFVYGGQIRISMEFFITDHWLIVLRGSTTALFGNPVGEIRPVAGAGIRLIL